MSAAKSLALLAKAARCRSTLTFASIRWTSCQSIASSSSSISSSFSLYPIQPRHFSSSSTPSSPELDDSSPKLEYALKYRDATGSAAFNSIMQKLQSAKETSNVKGTFEAIEEMIAVSSKEETQWRDDNGLGPVSFSIKPWVTALQCCARGKNLPLANRIVSHISSLSRIFLNDYIFGGIMTVARESGSPHLAEEYFLLAKELGVEMSLNIWNPLIYSLAAMGDTAAAEEAFKQMVESGVQPDTKIFGALMQAHVGSSDNLIAVAAGPRCEELLTEMQRVYGLIPDVKIYTTVIRANAKNVKRCEALVQNMQSQYQLLPDVNVLCTLLNAYAEAGEKESAEKLFNKIVSKPKSMLTEKTIAIALSCMIKLHSRLNDESGMLKYYQEFQTRNIRDDQAIARIFFSYYRTQGRYDMSNKWEAKAYPNNPRISRQIRNPEKYPPGSEKRPYSPKQK